MPITNNRKVEKAELTNARARTKRLLLKTAMAMFEQGSFPSITDLANASDVSRATAYRYFPTQSSLISAVVDESLGPILSWQPQQESAEERIIELLSFAYPQMLEHEGTLRAALFISLQQWANERAPMATQSDRLVRGNRKRLLSLAVEPLKPTLSPEALQRVIHALSLVYGSEVFMVLKDIWQLEIDGIQDVTQWMAKAIIRQAKEDIEQGK